MRKSEGVRTGAERYIAALYTLASARAGDDLKTDIFNKYLSGYFIYQTEAWKMGLILYVFL